ncbi:TPA: HD domain-containing protein [Klebsiella oxytoca]|nr:HD domain-containing protein [Klebsiella oxytoca]
MKISLQTVLDLLHNIMHPLSPELVHHLQRTGLICWYLGYRAGYDSETVNNALLASMLHNIGALSKTYEFNKERGSEFNKEHGRHGALMMSGVRFLRPVIAFIESRQADSLGYSQNALPNSWYLVNMADKFEFWLRSFEGDYAAQRHNIISGFLAGSEKWPTCLVNGLLDASREDGFWFRLSTPSLQQVLRVVSPLNEVELDHHDFLEVCMLISNIVDEYSSFTQTHSTSVAHVAAKLGELYGYDDYIRDKICIAGYLHDIGKLCIPLEILEKKGKLEPGEYEQMKRHSYNTLEMLHPISELGEIVPWAARHHERLDGSGYPFRLGAAGLDMPSRIIAVADVFTALTENRPYRQGMSSEKALMLLNEEAVNYRLDRDVINLLSHNIDVLSPLVSMS